MISFSTKLEQQSGLILFFPECTSWEYSCKEYYVIEWVHTEWVGLVNLIDDSLDQIYDKMPNKLLEHYEWYSLQKYKIFSSYNK